MILIMGSQMSLYGNFSCDSVQAPLIFMGDVVGWLARLSTPSEDQPMAAPAAGAGTAAAGRGGR